MDFKYVLSAIPCRHGSASNAVITARHKRKCCAYAQGATLLGELTKKQIEIIMPLMAYIPGFSPESALNESLHVAGLLAFLLFREAFPSGTEDVFCWKHPPYRRQWHGADPEKQTACWRMQDHSYGDSSGFTPDSLLMLPPVGGCNQMWRKPTPC